MAAALKENESLTYLDLGWNNIGYKGAKELAAALLKNKTLTELYLASNDIGDEGAKELAFALNTSATTSTSRRQEHPVVAQRGQQR